MRLSLITRIFFLFLLAMASLLAASIYAMWQIEQHRNSLGQLNDGYLPLIKTVTQIETIASNMEKDLARMLEVSDDRVRKVLTRLVIHYFPKVLTRNVDQARERLALLRARVNDQEQQDVLVAVERDIDRIHALQEEHLRLSKELFEENNQADEGNPRLEAELKTVERDLNRIIKLVGLRLDQQVSRRSLQIEQQGNRTLSAMVFMIVAALLVTVVVLLLVARSLSPVRKLTEGAKRISQGDYGHAITIAKNDEIGELAREFDSMRRSLIKRDEQLAKHREDLLRAERLAAVGRMASHVAHEIRNPLSSISLNTELLLDDLEDLPKTQQARANLRSIMKEIERLSVITDEYLALSRMPKGPKQPIKLAELVEHVVEVMGPAAMEKGAKLSSNIITEPEVLGDGNQIIQALINLIKNAVEAVERGSGTITILLNTAGDSAVLAVVDNGPGLPKDGEPERLFDPFFSTKPDGTGLGLSLSQSIAKEHGGALTCLNNAGGGACFEIRVPVHTPEETTA